MDGTFFKRWWKGSKRWSSIAKANSPDAPTKLRGRRHYLTWMANSSRRRANGSRCPVGSLPGSCGSTNAPWRNGSRDAQSPISKPPRWSSWPANFPTRCSGWRSWRRDQKGSLTYPHRPRCGLGAARRAVLRVALNPDSVRVDNV